MAPEAGGEGILFERLGRVLAPQLTLERTVARGGMGEVFRARDGALHRPVAVKVLLPEHATAELAARFLREAQALASLRHPGIVTVHQVAESGGLFYYVMEWLDGETLQDRLARGPLPRTEAIRIGAELLDALSQAHRGGWIHRDVKPGNIFLTSDRAVLTDFGIARPVAGDTTSLTETRQLIGTLAYMSPEQRDGGTVTEASDIYSAGLVIYEALSGRRWWQRDREDRDWSSIPGRLRTVLRKALEPEPARRWRDADGFRRALLAAGRVDPRPIMTGAMLLLAVGMLVTLYVRSRREAVSGRMVRMEMLASPGARGWADSIGQAIIDRLAAFPDLVVSGPFERGSEELKQPGLVLTGTVETIGAGLRATIQSRAGSPRQINLTRQADSATWRSLADSLAAQLIFSIYRSDTDADPSLPGDALPRTPAGWRAWSEAEPLFTQARWEEAAVAYRRAEALDTTCLLCSFRINDIDRWLDQPHDPARLARLEAHAERFPPHYRLLIQAASRRWPARLALMDSAARTRDFFLAAFHRGDEIFHRGPLFGRHRSEAIADLERTVQLRPDFAPGWEHLAWLRIAEGDSAGAASALARLTGPVVDPTSVGLRFLLQAAFAYRFRGPGAGDAVVGGALQVPEVASFSHLAVGPRLMLTFDAPSASLGMGRIFAGRRALAEVRSGLLAQVFGHLAMGRPDSALGQARVLADRVPGLESDLFAAQLAGALALADPDTTADGLRRAAAARDELREFTLSGAAPDETRLRAAWMVVLLSGRAGTRDAAPLSHLLLNQAGGGAARYYLDLVQADQLASRGLFDQALTRTGWSGDDLVRLADPFFSAITQFLRAEWFARQGNPRAAASTLLWHQANDFGTYPAGAVQPTEVNLALGNLARWKRALLLDGHRPSAADSCRDYRAVRQAWALGNALYRDRAAMAAGRISAIPCDP